MSIAKVHQMLYESNNFTRLPFKKYINELVNIILSSMNFEHQDVEVKTNIEVQNININHGVPLGIIFNELITNSLKYGFSTNTRNLITISVYEDDGLIQVIFEDNGVGISNFEEASSKSLGFKLIASLLKQIEADYHYDTQSQFKLSFSFPSNIQHSDFPIG
jgi:two-component sensor histidine kinase